MKNIIIKLLGGCSQNTFKRIENENEILKRKINNFEVLFDEIKIYRGTYPAWKAYGEFLEISMLDRNYLQDNMEDYLIKVSNAIHSFYLSSGREKEAEEWKKMHDDMLNVKSNIINSELIDRKIELYKSYDKLLDLTKSDDSFLITSYINYIKNICTSYVLFFEDKGDSEKASLWRNKLIDINNAYDDYCGAVRL